MTAMWIFVIVIIASKRTRRLVAAPYQGIEPR
jgi:hypothetical protein